MAELENETEEEARNKRLDSEYRRYLRLEQDQTYVLQLTENPEPKLSIPSKDPCVQFVGYVFFVEYGGEKFYTCPGADFADQMKELTKQRGSLTGAVIKVTKRRAYGQKRKWKFEIEELLYIEEAMRKDAEETGR